MINIDIKFYKNRLLVFQSNSEIRKANWVKSFHFVVTFGMTIMLQVERPGRKNPTIKRFASQNKVYYRRNLKFSFPCCMKNVFPSS